MANEIVYDVVVDTKSAEAGIKTIEAKAAQAGGASGGFGSLKEAIGSIGPAAMAAAAAIGTYLVGQALSEGIHAAIEQEDAINRMNYALISAGRYSVEASKDFNNFAAEIQKTTVVADEVALGYLSVASAFAKSNEQAKQMTTAALNLSTAMGTSAEGAVRQLGASLGGHAGMLARVIPEIRNLTEAQLKAGAAVDLVNQKFGGAAAQAAATFSGSLAKLKNTFGDVLEEIGFFFTKSDSLRKALNFVTETVSKLAVRLGLFRESTGDIFQPILMGIGYLVQGLVSTLMPPLEFVWNLFKGIGESIGAVGAALVALVAGDFATAGDILKQGIFESLGDEALLSFKGTEAAQAFTNSFLTTIDESKGLIDETMANIAKPPAVGPDPGVLAETLNNMSLIDKAWGAFDQKMTFVKANFAKNTADMKKSLFTNVVNGVGSAMNAVGQALVNGGNALSAFGKAMLGMFGKMATEIGQFYFLMGLATVYTDPGRGAGMIAGGLALMVFGGVLQALAGGGASGSSGGGASAGAGATSTSGAVGDNTTALNDTQERQRATTITVNIEGNVIGDKRTFGLQVADALNEAFGNDGIIIARGAIS